MHSRILLIPFALVATAALVGCGARTIQSRTTQPPAGPIQTATSRNDMIPPGTELAVRTNESITSDTAGRKFSAELAQDVVNSNGHVLAAKGSPVGLVVYQVDTGGTVGTPSLQLGLQSITINGRSYTVNSTSTEQRGEEGLGRNKRTAEMVGGGAVLGTVIGAIAGGGKGAAIGAIAGAAGGAATQVITNGKEVRVPAETILNFRLEESINLAG